VVVKINSWQPFDVLEELSRMVKVEFCFFTARLSLARKR
jgi:hypothetical protein